MAVLSTKYLRLATQQLRNGRGNSFYYNDKAHGAFPGLWNLGGAPDRAFWVTNEVVRGAHFWSKPKVLDSDLNQVQVLIYRPPPPQTNDDHQANWDESRLNSDLDALKTTLITCMGPKFQERLKEHPHILNPKTYYPDMQAPTDADGLSELPISFHYRRPGRPRAAQSWVLVDYSPGRTNKVEWDSWNV